MIKVEEKTQCTGCTACMQSCPKNAIRMERDREGFFYPMVDEAICINCNKCDKVCHMLHSNVKQKWQQKYFAIKIRNEEDRQRSRSGGLFWVLASQMLEQKGIVYGAVLCDDMLVRHVRATTQSECRKMQGSKYVESDIAGIYSLVKEDLLEGKSVLFSGTACQVAGLYQFLEEKEYENLYTLDIVCHGVESAQIFYDYIKFVEKKFGGRVEEFNFRDKTLGWNTHIESFVIKGKKHFYNNYASIFYKNMSLRPSCGTCKYTTYNRVGDITCADGWGIRKYYPEFDDNKGVSACLINSNKGHQMLQNITGAIELIELKREECDQPNLHKPSTVPENREDFWNLYYSKGMKAVMVRYGRYDILRRLKWRLSLIMRREEK